MRSIPTSEFLIWAAQRGIGPDTRYAEPRTLEFLDGRCKGGRWEYPSSPFEAPVFVLDALDAIEPWHEMWAYRRFDTWRCTDEDEPAGRLCTFIFHALGIEPTDSITLIFSKSELDALATLALATICFGWCVYDDLFLVPNHGRQILYFDHDEMLHVRCRERDSFDRLLAKMGPVATG